jgi:hypothetical protein
VPSDFSYEDDLRTGESLQVEFKREFPETVRNLSEVMAAFANAIGVSRASEQNRQSHITR